MNVLSLFDGMSCGQIALNRIGIKYDNYFASEIDQYAIKVAQHNYPRTIQLGDVQKTKSNNLPRIDLLIGGSPCQSFSAAGKGEGFDGTSGLFLEYARLLKEIAPQYFLLENVVMKQEYQDAISEYLEVEPIMIDSADFSAQSRKRLYWTNISVNTSSITRKDCVSDVMDIQVDDKYYLRNSYQLLTQSGKSRLSLLGELYRHGLPVGLRKPVLACEISDETPSGRSRQSDRVYSSLSKSPTLTASRCGDFKFDCGSEKINDWRNLTPIEAERLQTVPENYTSCVKDSQRYKMIGNGWTVDVIAHILKGIT